jgi:hypothetical protein
VTSILPHGNVLGVSLPLRRRLLLAALGFGVTELWT